MQNLKALNDENKLLYHKPLQRKFMIQNLQKKVLLCMQSAEIGIFSSEKDSMIV